MPKVAIVTPEKRKLAPLPEGLSGNGRAEAYLSGDKDPIHAWLHRLGKGQRLLIGPMANDCLGYVWEGEVIAGDVRLGAGSSLIAEHGESVTIVGSGEGDALVLTFRGAGPASHGRAGGHVHLLPADRVPGSSELSGPTVGGDMHSDSQCDTCSVWLHANHFAPSEPLSPEAAAKGVHSHTEDEVIFITRGAIQLGQKLFPAGTAVAIAGDTMYSIAPGPDGMSFINFRAGTPSDIRFAAGGSMSETQYWKERVARPQYLSPMSA